jgi:hypothetical protein
VDEDELVRKLRALPVGARRDLLRVLTSDPEVRADLIRQFYAREGTRNLAEVLIDLESDELLRDTVIALLRAV